MHSKTNQVFNCLKLTLVHIKRPDLNVIYITEISTMNLSCVNAGLTQHNYKAVGQLGGASWRIKSWTVY